MIVRTCLLLMMFSVVAEPLQAADQLEWKLSTGDTLRYAVQNEMATKATVGGFDSNTRLIQTMRMAWNVESPTANNSYLLSQVIERIRVEMVPDGRNSIVFDSGKQEVPDDPIARSLGNVFRKLVDRPFSITMAPTGAIENVSIPEDLLETLKTATAGSQAGLDERALKQMLSQTAVILPSRAVEKGDQWTSTQNVDLPFARLQMSAVMTYQGVNDEGLAVIGYVPDVSLVPRKDSPVQLTLSGAQGTGEVLFDRDNGRVVRMQLNLHMEMQTAVRGQQVLQNIDQQTVMVLQDQK